MKFLAFLVLLFPLAAHAQSVDASWCKWSVPPECSGSGGGVGASVDLTSEVTGTLPVANGGTGATSLTDGGILLGSGTGAVTPLGVATNGQIPIGDGTTDPVLATITGTSNRIVVTNGAGSITLNTGSDVAHMADVLAVNPAADGAFINLAAVNGSSGTEGFVLPQAAGFSQTGAGFVGLDTTSKAIKYGDGTISRALNGEYKVGSFYVNVSSMGSLPRAASIEVPNLTDQATTVTHALIYEGLPLTLTRMCVQVGATPPTTTEGCKIQLVNNGSDVTGGSLNFGGTTLDATNEIACTSELSENVLSTSYWQVQFQTVVAGQCPDAAGCACAASSFTLRGSVWARQNP